MWKTSVVVVVVAVLLLGSAAQAQRLDITKPGDTIVGVPNDNDWPGGEAPPLAIDDDPGTKYLHFKGDFDPDPGTGGAGFRVTPSAPQTLVVGLTFTTANDADPRDPATFEIYGSNVSIDGPYELIASGEIVDFTQSTPWPRATKNDTPISFDNDVAYDHYEILITDIRDRAAANSMQVAEVELLGMSMIALNPTPADGALHADTWVSLSWSAGDFGVTHDLYLSDNFDAVNDGTADAFRGNQAVTNYIVGFPGFPYPDGLVPGTTYYWRVDDVEADGVTKHAGKVWSFMIPPKQAYRPIPGDGAKFLPTDVTLEWTPGFGAKLHTVYFGDNFDDVNDAVGGFPQGNADFTPAGPLEIDKTYYWRVDEFDIMATHKGEVWSLTTAGLTGGVKGQYFKGMNFENLVLTRTDAQIDFSWGDGGPDPIVGEEQFSARWTGEVEAAFTETYAFYTNSDDGVRLWVDDQLLISNWTNHGNTENVGTIDLVAGQTYSVKMEYYEDGGGAVAQLRWSSPSTPKQLIPQAALSFLVSANSPVPANGAIGVKLVSDLTWSPGEFAASHEVYFGADADAVANATKASPEYKSATALGAETFDPGKLAWDTAYYWRVDEVNAINPDGPWEGGVWTFATGDFLVVDDFEAYDDVDPAVGQPGVNRIFDKWFDGFGTTTNGALVGNDLPPYTEQAIVHGGAQSMIYRYDNALKTSEATLTLVYPRDWTEEGVSKLSMWVRGDAANEADRVFVALNGNAVVYHADPAATQIVGWNQWVIDLQSFAGASLTNVNTITIGIGTKNSPAAGGAGTMYFDDIRLTR